MNTVGARREAARGDGEGLRLTRRVAGHHVRVPGRRGDRRRRRGRHVHHRHRQPRDQGRHQHQCSPCAHGGDRSSAPRAPQRPCGCLRLRVAHCSPTPETSRTAACEHAGEPRVNGWCARFLRRVACIATLPAASSLLPAQVAGWRACQQPRPVLTGRGCHAPAARTTRRSRAPRTGRQDSDESSEDREPQAPTRRTGLPECKVSLTDPALLPPPEVGAVCPIPGLLARTADRRTGGRRAKLRERRVPRSVGPAERAH